MGPKAKDVKRDLGRDAAALAHEERRAIACSLGSSHVSLEKSPAAPKFGKSAHCA